MQRLRAKIIETKEIGKKTTEQGFTSTETLCKVKIGDGVHKSLKFPDGTKDREHWVLREAIFPWELNKDNQIVLHPDETQDVIHPIQIQPLVNLEEKQVRTGIQIYEPDEAVKTLEWKADFGELGTTEGIAERVDRLHLKGELTLKVEDELTPGAYLGKVKCGDEKAIEVALTVISPGTSILYTLDINRDGFAEKVLENTYLRAVVTPHFGAGLSQFWYKARNLNQFAEVHHHENTEGFLDIGGHQDHIENQGWPGELWNAEYTEAETGISQVTYRFELQKTKGVTISREIEIPPDTPFVYQRVILSYAGKKDDKAEKKEGEEKSDDKEKAPKPDEVELVYKPRVRVALGGNATFDQVVKIPTQEKLHTWRVEDSDWGGCEDYFGFQAGFALAHDESTGSTFALFTDPKAVDYFRRCYSGEKIIVRTYTFEPYSRKVKLGIGKQATYGYLYAVGSASACTQEGMAMFSEGETFDGQIPIFLIARHIDDVSQCIAQLSWDGGSAEVRMHCVEYRGVGGIWQGKASIPLASRPTLNVTVNLDDTSLVLA